MNFFKSGVLGWVETNNAVVWMLLGFCLDHGQAYWRAIDSPKKWTDEFVLFAYLLFTANKSNLSVCFLENLQHANLLFGFIWPLETMADNQNKSFSFLFLWNVRVCTRKRGIYVCPKLFWRASKTTPQSFVVKSKVGD